MKSEPDNKKAEQEYIFGYDSDMTLKFHTSRTAETHAFWFLPYLKPGMTLLDCGCGSGSITVGLAKVVEPAQVAGIDISEAEIERARKRAAEANISNIRFETGDLYQLTFADDSFDALFSHNVLEHIPEPSKALQEMHRVLKPGGIIGVRDIDYGGFLTAPDDDGIFEHHFKVGRAYWEKTGGHPQIGRILGRLFCEAGFVDVNMSASYQVFSDPESRKLWAQQVKSNFSDPKIMNGFIKSGLINDMEADAIIKAWPDWAELPGAIHARSHCEAIGRKA
jgi:ubiquinone/menaquinone biosynthesis C-methylase UbiE